MQLQRLVIQPNQLDDGHILLVPSQLHYLQRVLRLRQGDRFIAMDGQGQAWIAVLAAKAHESQAEILEAITAHTELPIRVTLVAALPKGSGFDEVVRQATELGVDQILPVMSDRTLLNPSSQKRDRWQRIANEATEQSERLYVPHIAEPIAFGHHLQQEADRQQISDAPIQKYLGVARGTSPHLLECLQAGRSSDSTTPIYVAIGPEGGWTDTEVKQAIAVGYQPISLGDRILRAVTAPVVALSLIAAVWERR